MALVGRIERCRRQLERDLLRVALRACREIRECRRFDLENRVLTVALCVRSAAIAVCLATSIEPERPPKSNTVYDKPSVGPYCELDRCRPGPGDGARSVCSTRDADGNRRKKPALGRAIDVGRGAAWVYETARRWTVP